MLHARYFMQAGLPHHPIMIETRASAYRVICFTLSVAAILPAPKPDAWTQTARAARRTEQ
ncbi:MAG: hypothetical protein ACYCY9_08300 [Thiobacillus sp.]